jgi:DNA-binding SARP family transcriptional activator
MPGLCIRLFGRFVAGRGEDRVEGLGSSKLQELLSYLLLYRGRPHPRENLAALLWGDTPTAQSKKYLRQSLWQLQSALNSQTEPSGNHILLVETDWININPEADFWLDVAEFEDAYADVEGVPGAALDEVTADRLKSAVKLYKGDLMEGCYQDWCLYERERLQNMYLSMLDKLMLFCEAHKQYETGLQYGIRILNFDRAREHTHRRLMRLRYLAGDRTGALRQYEQCCKALDEELGVKPAPKTLALCERMRANQDSGAAALSYAPELDEGRMPSCLQDMLTHLEKVRAALSDLHSQIQDEIRAVKVNLRSKD